VTLFYRLRDKPCSYILRVVTDSLRACMSTLLVVRSSMLRQTNLRHASPKLLNPKQIHIPAVGIRDRIPPALVLLLLAPAIGELLSGSSPLAEYFTPFSLTILTALYGGGALLAREIKIRWRKGVGSLLLLGACARATPLSPLEPHLQCSALANHRPTLKRPLPAQPCLRTP
jgi:hypothetical protein